MVDGAAADCSIDGLVDRLSVGRQKYAPLRRIGRLMVLPVCVSNVMASVRLAASPVWNMRRW